MTEIPDAVLRARQMYIDGAPTRAIEAQTGLSRTLLYRWLDGRGGLPPRCRGMQTLPRAAKAAARG